MTEPEADRELVEEFLRSRSEHSFRLLYRRHDQALHGLAQRLSGGRRDLADEVVQETWVRALERLAAFEWRSSLRTWLCGIALRCTREQLREPPELPAGELAPPGYDPDPEPADQEIAPAAMQQALLRLPFGYRQAIVLHDVEGRTHEEIAALLGVAAGTSKSQLSRARAALRRSLRQQMETGP